MGAYENCIASGESPQFCAATFGAPGTNTEQVNRLSIGQLVELEDGRQAKVVALPNAQTRDNPNATVVLELTDTSLAPFQRKITMPGGTIVTPLGKLVSFTQTGEITGTRDIPFNQFFGSGTSGAGTSFASTQAAQAQDEAFRREQDRLTREATAAQNRLDRDFREEQNRLAEEAALKRGRLSTLTDLIQSFVGAQAQARDTLANLQPDPFRFAAVAGGIAPFGVTPQQGFTEQLQQFASAPVPTADPNASLPSIESAIQGLTGANVPLAPQIFGAADGIIEMRRDGDTFSMVPSPAVTARLVGEGKHGEGLKAGTAEVMITSPQGTAILPLGKGMQEGGAIGFPFEPLDIDFNTAFPTFARTGIFGSLGLDRIPTVNTRQIGGRSFRAPSLEEGSFGAAGQLNFLERLGVSSPTLFRRQGEPTVFFRDPRTGEAQPFTNRAAFEGSGFDFGNVQALGAPAFSQLTQNRGAAITSAFDPSQFDSTSGTSLFSRFSVPIIEPTTGTVLPNPADVASAMNRLRLTDPATFNDLLNAYENAVTPAGNSAGFGAARVLATIQAALPFGAERSPTGLR